MNTQARFADAHAMTRATLKAGDNYAVTFAACLKYIGQLVKAISSGDFKRDSVTPDEILQMANVEAFKVAGWVMGDTGRAYVGEFTFKAKTASDNAAYYLKNFESRHLQLVCHYQDGSEKTFNILAK